MLLGALYNESNRKIMFVVFNKQNDISGQFKSFFNVLPRFMIKELLTKHEVKFFFHFRVFMDQRQVYKGIFTQ